jgi:hypothetical protein
MGKYLEKFKQGIKKMDNKIREMSQDDEFREEEDGFDEEFDDKNLPREGNYDEFGGLGRYDDVGIQPSQKPESFHHFILENQYKDLERSIRGFKDVFDKNTQQWRTIRKEEHCFTDEEAEEILRTAQSHLATDIKLGFINKDAFPIMMDTIYQEIAFLFESIAEYRYGRYGGYEKQYEMKLQNHKIFLELFTRIQANYSRSIQGQENRFTHDSVKGQESLQQMDRDFSRNRMGYQ